MMKMEILKSSDTSLYQSNVLNTELIRTGTNSSGSCFFYSIYIPFQEFRKLTEDNRLEYIKEKRQELADKINNEEWLNIQNGNVAFLQIIETMRIMIHSIPSIIKDDFIQKYNIDNLAIDILFTLLNPSTVEKEILPQWDTECSQQINKESFMDQMKNKWFEIYKIKIKKSIDDLEKKIDPHINKMSFDQKSKVIDKLSHLTFPIFDFITHKALSNFKNEIADINKWLNIFIFTSVLEYLNLNINIIIIDSETGKPYEGMKLFYDKKKFDNDNCFVVILYFKDIHFESLGRKITTNNKTVIQRLFKKDDPFIITCLSYLEPNE